MKLVTLGKEPGCIYTSSRSLIKAANLPHEARLLHDFHPPWWKVINIRLPQHVTFQFDSASSRQ
eukprot:12916403-Prorocentrum_lima.AAC.1